MKDFLSDVWGTDEGWAYIGFKNETTDKWSQDSYKYPENLDTIVKKLEEGNRTASIYFCPHLFKEEGRRIKSNALPTRWLWVDKDSGSFSDITNFDYQPSVCWQTSEGKWQAMWRLTKPISLDFAEALNKKIVAGIKGDKSGWDAGQMLRVPESINYKYTPRYHGMFLWEGSPPVTPEDIAKLTYGDEPIYELDKGDAPPIPKNLPSFEEAMIHWGPKFSAPVWRSLQATPTAKDDWSNKIWNLECLLVDAGIPLEHVFAIAKGSPWNKYGRDKRPEAALWAEVFKVYKTKAKPEFDEPLEDLPWTTLDDLLLHAERPEWLVEDMWMAKNVGWIAGEGKSYKSVMSLDLALSVASGHPFLGKFKVNDPGTVLMLQEEDPIWRVAHRIQAMAAAKGITDMDVAVTENSMSLNLKNTGLPLHVSIGGRLTFMDEGKMDAVRRMIDIKRPKIVILDPMFMLSAGMDEFKSGEMAGVLNTLKQWRNEFECAIAVVHHFRKATGVDTQKLYGSMALYAWSENSLLVQRESRDTNLVSIRRDIKDAPSDERIAVEFINIDEEYVFELKDVKPSKFNAEGRPVAEAIKAHALEEPLTIKGIEEFTGLSNRKVREEVKNLEEAGLVATHRKGRGGNLHIVAAPSLYTTDDMGEMIME